MRRFLKITTGIVVVILAIALIVPMALKGKISEIVKQEAGKLLTATLDFDELNISLLRHFPNASLELKGLELISGVEPFVGETVVAADRISVVVNLASLFGDEGFEVRRVLLDRPLIHGHVGAGGEVNWDVMVASDEPEEPEESDEPEESEEASAFRLALKDVTISEAKLRYDDDSSRMYASIAPLNLNLRGDFSAERSTLKLKTTASNICFTTGEMKLARNLEAAINAEIDAHLKEQRFVLKENTFRLNAIEMMLDGEVGLKEEGMAVDMRLKSNRIRFRELLSLIPAFYTEQFDDLKASGELTLEAWAKGEMVGDRLPAFDLRLGVNDGSFKYAMLPQSVTDIHIAAGVKNPGGTLDATSLEVSDFGMKLAGNTLKATLKAATPMSDLQFAASMVGKVDLGAIKEVYPLGDSISLAGLVTLDVKAAGRLSDIEKQRFEQMEAAGNLTLEQMEAELTGLPTVGIERLTVGLTPKALTLGECQLRVGRSDLKANGQLANYLGWLLRDDLLTGRLYIQSELLDLNELMGALPASEEETSAEQAATGEPESSMTAPKIPKNLDLALQTSVKQVLFQQMTLKNFTGNIALEGGTASLSNLKMEALGGKLAASGSYSTAQNPAAPRLSLSADIDKASFSRTFQELELVQKMVPIFEKTGGDYSMHFDLKGAMTSDMSIDYPTLNASGEISSSNIQLGNVPIFNALTSALNADKIQSSLEGKLVVVKFTIANGRLSTKPFDLKLGSTNLNLSGSTGLDQSIDYTAKVSLPGKAGAALQNLNVKIGGTFSSPKFSVDVASAAKEAATNVVNQQIEKLTGSESLNQEVEKQAEKLREEARKAGDKLIAEAEKQKAALVEKAGNPLAKLAAEKAGDALVKEAQKQADKLVAKAEEQISNLQTKVTGQ